MARFILGHRLNALGARNPRVERLLYRVDRLFFDLLLWLLRLIPVDVAVRIGAGVAAALAPRFKKSSAMLENLQVAFPDRDAATLRCIARECWANAGAVVAEFPHLEEICAAREPPRLEITVRGDIATLRDPSRPAVFVAAHQANWEMIAAAIVRRGVPFAAVYSPATNPLLDELLTKWRRGIGCELLPSEDSMRPMMRALAAGRSLGIVMDRRVDSGKPVTFFGHVKPSTLVPARLAIRYDCELVPVQIERLHGARFRVTFHAPIAPDAMIADDTARAIAMTQRVHELFEQWIRERPGQWFCSKRLWPKGVYAHPGKTAAATAPDRTAETAHD